ncbi:MAG: GGDEF domain-containing protein [Polyangiaceae bacterium]
MIAGWVVDWPVLTSVIPGQVTMKVNTALAFVLSGIALLLVNRSSPSLRWVSPLCAGVAVFLAVLTLGEYVTGQVWGIDQLLIRDSPHGAGTSHPGRMAPNTATNFVLLGVALLLVRSRRERVHYLMQGLPLLSLLTTLIAFLGYAFQAHVLVGLFSQTRMAVHTILAFGALGTGALLASAEHAWVADALAPGIGGRVGRRLLPAALILPVSIGLLMLAGFRAHWYDAAFGAALVTSVEIVSFTILIWTCVQSLNAGERVREISKIDELTQLLNRSGFLAAAELMLVGPTHRQHGSLLIFADLDGMKAINDRLGHRVGDEALIEAGAVLRKAFRGSDLVARLSGDEFAAFAAGAAVHVDALLARISEGVSEVNSQPNRSYLLELSVGTVNVEPQTREPLAVWLARADAAMYLVKAQRKGARAAAQPAALATRPIEPRSLGMGKARSN